jgi:tetratricopeptide (TPR) repeat protein
VIGKRQCIGIFCLAAIAPIWNTAVAQTQLHESCFSKDFMYAVPACERIIETSDAGHKVHFRLAKMYQKQRQFEKAKTTLERALVLFDAQGDLKRVNETKRFKSNVDEAIWLSEQSKQETDSSEYRIKCTRFAKILPLQAVSACDQYLAAFPNDKHVVESKAIAINALAKKSQLKEEPRQELVAVSRTPNPGFNSSRTSIDRVASVADAGVQRRKEELLKAVATDTGTEMAELALPQERQQSVNTTSVSEVSQSAIDPQVIADIKQELNSLYAMLRKQQAETPERSQSISYSEKGNRYALVVGNAAYSKSIGRLKNSVNDALDISAALTKMKFEVQSITDGSLQELEKAVSILANKIQENDTVLFYYAGHGVAIEGENYLLPVNAGITDSVDVKYKSLNLSYVLDKLDRGSNGVTMVVLDACRNNPFPVSRGAMRAGLVQSSGPVGTIIAYSTAPGDVALDGTGRNGLYTKHLLEQMAKPNIKLEDVFKRVRVAVGDDTQGSQVPWENSSLRGDFYFTYD